MDYRVKYMMYYLLQDVNSEGVIRWLEQVEKIFIPVEMQSKIASKGKFRSYNKKKLVDSLEYELSNDTISIYLSGGTNVFSISGNKDTNVLIFSVVIEKENCGVLEKIMEEEMTYRGLAAYKVSYDDDFWQNTKDLDNYRVYGKSLRGIKTTNRKFGLREKIVDIELNAGHSHFPKGTGIWFGSCHKMWFGKPYYDYISKEKLKNFSNCYENVELENEVIRITLYDDIWAYDEKKNRKIQWDFRKSVGMDEVAHALENAPKNKETDASIEITNGVFPNGGVKMIKYYYDSSNELISKSKATKVRICEFAQDGKLLFEEEKDV